MTQSFENNLRSDIINIGLERGARARDIDRVLKDNNLNGYNPITSKELWSKVPSAFVKDLSEMSRGLTTAGGAILASGMNVAREAARSPQSIPDRLKTAFIGAVNNQQLKRAGLGAYAGAQIGSRLGGLGTVGGGVLGSMVGLVGPKGVADAMLGSYGTSVDELKAGQTTPQDVFQGILQNPLYSTIDYLSAGGAGEISKLAKAAGKSIEGSELSRKLSFIIPSEEMRNFNRSLSQDVVNARAKLANNYKAYNTLDASFTADRERLVRNIIANEDTLTKEEKTIATALKRDLRANEKKAIELGLLDKTEAKNNVISQYVMHHLKDDSPLLFQDVMRMVTGESPTTPKVQKLIDKASKLYDNGDITWLTQKLSPTTDPMGNVIASKLVDGEGGYFGTKRIIGRTSAKSLASVLDESIKSQLDEVTRASEAIDVVNKILDTPGVGKLITKDIKDIGKNKVAVSKEEFRKQLVDAFNNDQEIDVGKAIRASISKSDVKSKGQYAIDKMYLDAIQNALKPQRKTIYRTITNAFKKAVLANPHWLMVNRIGNFTNNSVGEVRARHYDKATKWGDIVPDQLKQQTAFNSYIGAGIEDTGSRWSAALSQPISRTLRAFKQYGASEGSYKDIAKLLSSVYASTNDITANPLFRLESGLELRDRYANFIMQAEKYGKSHKMSTRSVIKKASKDDNLFNELNTKVNKDLGDYVGRNYFLPNTVYDVVGDLVPFYRFLTQTGRTSIHQMQRHPLAFQAANIVPAKVGNMISNDVVKDYNLDPESYEGGFPYFKSDLGEYRTVGFEPLPFGAVAKDVGDILTGKSMESIFSPLFTMGADISRFQKLEGKTSATTPRLTYLQVTDAQAAKDFQPTLAERMAYGTNLALGNMYNPYRMVRDYIPTAVATVSGKGRRSVYDTDPLLENPRSYRKVLPEELVGRWAGIQTRAAYPIRPESKSQAKKNARATARNQRRILLRAEE